MTQSEVDTLRERIKELAYKMWQQDVADVLETALEFEDAVDALAARAAIAEEPREQGAEATAQADGIFVDGEWRPVKDRAFSSERRVALELELIPEPDSGYGEALAKLACRCAACVPASQYRSAS